MGLLLTQSGRRTFAPALARYGYVTLAFLPHHLRPTASPACLPCTSPSAAWLHTSPAPSFPYRPLHFSAALRRVYHIPSHACGSPSLTSVAATPLPVYAFSCPCLHPTFFSPLRLPLSQLALDMCSLCYPAPLPRPPRSPFSQWVRRHHPTATPQRCRSLVSPSPAPSFFPSRHRRHNLIAIQDLTITAANHAHLQPPGNTR